MSANSVMKAEQSQPNEVTTPHRLESIEPLVDIFETAEALTLIADLPGVREGNLEITVNKDILIIDGLGADAPEGQKWAQEFRHGRYYRQFRLTDAIDTDLVSAELTRGVLTLRLPKAEAAVPRRIEVTTVH